jgi:replication-associated recombination protein RarA
MILKPLFSEILRPRQLSDLALPQKDIDHLEQMVASRAIMNLLFYGKTGTGKTSAARVILSIVAPRASTEIDGSLLNKAESVRERVERYASTMTLYGGEKICFLDQLDLASKLAQNLLLKVVEDSRICRFIFAANDPSKLVPAMRSRLVAICFDVSASDQAEVQMRLMERYRRVFEETGIPYDQDRVQDIVRAHYPDLRAIANHLDMEFVTPASAAQAHERLRPNAEAVQ